MFYLCDVMKRMVNRILSMLLLVLMLPTITGVRFTSHVCSHSGHAHVDVDLLPGIASPEICLSDDGCCSGHHACSDAAAHDEPCRETNKLVHFGGITVVEKHFHCATPLFCIAVPRCLVPDEATARSAYFSPIPSFGKLLPRLSWQAFSCVYRC